MRHFLTAMRRFWRWSKPEPRNWPRRPPRPCCHKLKDQKDLFKAVEQLGGGEFFARNGLLFLLDRGRRKNRRAVRPGAAADSGAGGRSKLARTGAGPDLRLGGPAAEHVHARPDGAAADHVRHHARGRDRPGGTRAFSWRELTGRQAAGAERPAAHYRDHARSSTIPRSSRARSRSPAIRKAVADLKLDSEYRRAGAADRPGADPGRGIRHAQGKCRAQRARLARVPDRHPLAGACARRASSSRC